MSSLLENTFLLQLSGLHILMSSLLFVWTGFVRSGLGFGGAALGLPLMLFIYDQPLFWLPLIGFHLLFFSSLTLRTRLHNVDWPYLKQSSLFIVPAALVGVFGLLNLPTSLVLVFIYGITLLYGILWLMEWTIRSRRGWLEKILLALGGYVSGILLSGAPIMVAVFMNNVAQSQFRDTLFALWFMLVALKMSTFVMMGVDLHFLSSLLLLPAAAIGHIAGLKAHDYMLRNRGMFQRIIGGMLVIVCVIGIATLIISG